MSKKNLKIKKEFGKAYLEFQPKLDALIKQIVLDAGSSASSKFECWKSDNECIKALECRSRDGFIAASDNCGGYQFNNFTTLGYIEGTGSRFASKEACEQIQKQTDQGYKYALEAFKENNADAIKGIPEDKLNYHDLYELGHGKLAEELSNYEQENLSGDEDTIMINLRILYAGIDDNGVHTAFVSAAVNWEGPYHRSHISWMPGFKCEATKEVEVTFKNLREAKTKLTKAMKLVKEQIIG